MRKIFSKIILLFISSIFLSTSINAQIKSIKELPLQISYFGHEYLEPGIKIGTQFSIREWSKEKKRKERTISKSIFISPQVGLNAHFGNHVALLFNVELGIQRKNPKGWFRALSVGVGDLVQFNWGVTYELQEDGSINEKKWATRSYLFPSLNLMMGKEINTKLSYFGKFTLAGKANYNTFGLLPQVFWELGVKLSL